MNPPRCVKCGGPAALFLIVRVHELRGQPGPTSYIGPWCLDHGESAARSGMGEVVTNVIVGAAMA